MDFEHQKELQEKESEACDHLQHEMLKSELFILSVKKG